MTDSSSYLTTTGYFHEADERDSPLINRGLGSYVKHYMLGGWTIPQGTWNEMRKFNAGSRSRGICPPGRIRTWRLSE
jgi:hypothetical protein